MTSLVVEGVRRLDPAGAVRTRHPEPSLVLERAGEPASGLLHPWEAHVLSLVDGERSVMEIGHESEAGEGQTLKALYAFLAAGIVRVRGRKVRALDQDFVPEDGTFSVLESFNAMYRHVFAYMVREVGPIAENVLAKYLNKVREARPEILAGVGLQRDGCARRGGGREERRPYRRGSPPQRARRRPQRAALRGAARGEAHARRRPRERDRARAASAAVSTPTRQQVRGAAILLAVALLFALWRLLSRP